jgi:hypothetical protein
MIARAALALAALAACDGGAMPAARQAVARAAIGPDLRLVSLCSDSVEGAVARRERQYLRIRSKDAR